LTLSAETVWRLANVALAAEHLAPAVATAWFGWRQPGSRASRLICWPLAAFFGTGVGSHVLNAANTTLDVSPAEAGWFALRAAFIGSVVAVTLPRGVRFLAGLPTREDYDRRLAEKRALLAEKDAAIAAEHAARADLQTMLAVETRRRRKVTAEADRMRENIEHLRWQQVNEAEYARMRELLHAIRDAAS
jgi:hypothetical protein